ncbi:MAG: hypothetical protein J6A29_02860 [Clostridia bacterium]|nr:hypothetical protein [Clostridia bacterium]
MSLYKKFILFLAIISAVLCLFIVVDTYAKYMTSAKQVTNIPIAKWNIKVNNVSIKNNQNLTSVISPVFPGTEHIASGIIAPTAEGYFDLDFDFTDADVSFSYNVSVSPNTNSSVTDLVVTGYSIDAATPIYFSAGDATNITDNIYYSSGIDTRKIRIFIKWIDDDTTATMDNSQDTAATLDATALLDVKIVFTQIADTTSVATP